MPQIYGDGTVHYDASRSRWVATIDAGRDPGTGKRRRWKRTAKTKTEANKLLRDLRKRREEAISTQAPVTVADVINTWFTIKAPESMNPKTLKSVESLISVHLLPSIGSVRVDALRVETIEEMLTAKAKAGYARATLKQLRGCVAQAFDFAISRRNATWNPARMAVIPRAAGVNRKARALTSDEVDKLFAAAAETRLGVWVIISASIGLRPGETSGLEWDSIDLDAGTVIVHQSLAFHDSDFTLKGTKTGRPRTIRLPEIARDALSAHQKRQEVEIELAGDRWPARWSGLVFRTSNGTPLDSANTRRMVQSVAESAGIGHVTPYDLRHTATTRLSAAGVAPELLADLLGHRDTRMVFAHYRHPVTPVIEVAAQAP